MFIVWADTMTRSWAHVGTWWWCAGLWPAACSPTRWVSEAAAGSAEPRPGAPWDQRKVVRIKRFFFFNRLLKWSSVGLRWQRQHSHQVTKQTHREGEGSVWARQSHKISKVEGKYLTLSSRCIKREGKRQTVRWGKKTQIVRRLP